MSKGRVEERLAKVEGILEQMDKRLNHIEGDIRDLRADIGKLREEIDRNFKWTLGIVISMWVTIILGILAIFLKLS